MEMVFCVFRTEKDLIRFNKQVVNNSNLNISLRFSLTKETKSAKSLKRVSETPHSH